MGLSPGLPSILESVQSPTAPPAQSWKEPGSVFLPFLPLLSLLFFFSFLLPACDSSRHLSNECEGIYTGQSEMYEADRLHLITANGSPRR